MTEASLWSVRDQQALTATFSIQKKVSQMNWMNLLAGLSERISIPNITTSSIDTIRAVRGMDTPIRK